MEVQRCLRVDPCMNSDNGCIETKAKISFYYSRKPGSNPENHAQKRRSSTLV